MPTNRRNRVLLLGSAAALLLALAVWAATQGAPGSAQNDPAAGSPDGAQVDGMDMGGMSMGGDRTVRIDPAMARALGVTFVEAEIEPFTRTIRSTGHVTYDETRLSSVTPKIGGWVEQLHVNFTGQDVRRGQPLLEIYSPELVLAQEELLSATRLEARLRESRAPGVAERSFDLIGAARRRLLLWDIGPEQIQRIERTGEVQRTLTLHAPFGGFVVKRNVELGQAIESGQTLYQLADLSAVWIEVDVYESDLRFVREGETADIRIDAYPGELFFGRVSYVYPDVRRDTRTARVRIELRNDGERIKPGMFATVNLTTTVAERAVVVPRDAVMRTGTRNVVFVEDRPGSYEIRAVEVGADAGGKTQILSGLLAGERVVSSANFLLDAESRLMETMMGQPGMPGMDMDMPDTRR